MKYPVKISVLMPCFNAESIIMDSISSTLNQTMEDLELIIIDDASTDNTLEAIHAIKDSRIKIITLKKNIGNYAARNIGLSMARGKYICMLDADDISMKNRLQVQYEFLERHKSVGCIGCNYNIISEEGNLLFNMRRECNFSEFKIKLLEDNYMLQSTIAVRNSLLKKYNISYNEDFKYAADYHFVFQCSKFFKIYNIQDTLVDYRVSPKGITQTKFLEQQNYAAKIRLEIFAYYFEEILSSENYLILDSLFNKHSEYRETKILEIEQVVNKILEYNYQFKKLNQKKLYDMFNEFAIRLIVRNKNM